jgi:hypothetical protein
MRWYGFGFRCASASAQIAAWRQSVATTSVESISSMEIITSANFKQEESETVDDGEQVRVIAKHLGFKRAGPDFQSHVRECLKDRVGK